MTDRELFEMALDVMEAAIKAGDWQVDGACDPDLVLNALRARLAQPEPEPVDKAGSPCKEFWDWLPKAYRDGDKGEDAKFTKYNMEVAYLAGKQSQLEQEPTARDINEVILNSIHDSSEVVAPPQREWCQCKDAPNDCTYEKNCRVPQIDAAFKRIEWQGLTDDQVIAISEYICDEQEDELEFLVEFARAIEAKLKEKNG